MNRFSSPLPLPSRLYYEKMSLEMYRGNPRLFNDENALKEKLKEFDEKIEHLSKDREVEIKFTKILLIKERNTIAFILGEKLLPEEKI